MSSFKDVLEQDMHIFINIDEFAEMYDIDGQQVSAVIDADLLKDRPRQPLDMYHATEGVYVEEVVLFVRSSDIERPVTTQNMRINDQLYQVNKCVEFAGILEITLEAYRS